MKFTNKDAKIRFYDGSQDTSGGAVTYDITSIISDDAGTFADSAATWTAQELEGKKVHFTSGNAAGNAYEILANTDTDITIKCMSLTHEGIEVGDTFTIGIPYYFELCLDNGDFSAPIGIKKHEEMLVLDRGNVTACAHYINDNDAGIMEPLSISFSAMINDSDKFLSFLDMIEGNTVNGNTMVTTKGHSERIVLPGEDLSFFDTTKKCFDIEYKATGTTNSICYAFRECYFELSELTFTEAEDGVTLSLTGACYGNIIRRSDWNDGTNVLA